MKKAPVITLPAQTNTTPATVASEPPSFIRMNEAVKRTALSKSMIYKLLQDGKFPAQISLSGVAKAFISSEIDDWIKNKIDASRKGVSV